MNPEKHQQIDHEHTMPDVHIGEGIIDRLPMLWNMRRYGRGVVITDEHVPQYIRSHVHSVIPIPMSELVLPAGEKSKSFESTIRIWHHLHDSKCDRKSLVVNLGGGVVGDVGGFAAATYMRGIDWINIPTTLLSQVDASVGGKTGINLGEIKNLIGVIKQPRSVIIDVNTLASLPRRELLSGFAEIIKHGIVRDAEYFMKVTAKKPQDFTPSELTDIIRGSVRIKSSIVTQDPLDTGIRKSLNFGHTIGHAVESLSQTNPQPLTHGEAVSIGMAIESSIAERAGLLTGNEKNAIIAALTHAGLPTRLPEISDTRLKEQMRSDKKNSNGDIRWVMPTSIGTVNVDMHIDEAIVNSVLQEAQTL